MNENLNNHQEVNNSVFLMGTITKSPDLKETVNGRSYCHFTVATKSTFQGTDGNEKSMNNYHNIQAWGKMAELCNENYRKGSKVKLRGKLKTSSYQKDGQKVIKTSVEVLKIQPINA